MLLKFQKEHTLLFVMVMPFILGVIVTIATNSKKGILLGCLSFLLYLFFGFIYIWIIQHHYLTSEIIHNIIIGMIYVGVAGIISAAAGGLLGNFINRRRR